MLRALAAITARGRRAVWAYGYAGAARRAAHALVGIGVMRRQDREDEFDRRNGTDTARVVRLEHLSVHGANRRFGHRYQATNPAAFRLALGSLAVPYEELVFVDIGSGKGRALLLASEFPFKRIIGVEFSEDLNDTARANIKRFAGIVQLRMEVETVCVDAVEYEFPEEPLLLYLYNPFLEPMMRPFMQRLDASLSRLPRAAYIVLCGDMAELPPLAAAIEATGFVRMEASRALAFSRHAEMVGPGSSRSACE